MMSYNDIIIHILNQEDEDTVCKFKHIVANKGPLNDSHPNYKWSCYNVIIEWKKGYYHW